MFRLWSLSSVSSELLEKVCKPIILPRGIVPSRGSGDS